MGLNVCVSDTVGAGSVVVLRGDLDVYTSPFLRRDLHALFERGRARIVLNLEKVRYVDSTGIGVLLDGLQRARALGGSLSLVTADERVLRVIKLLGLTSVLNIFRDQVTALAAL